MKNFLEALHVKRPRGKANVDSLYNYSWESADIIATAFLSANPQVAEQLSRVHGEGGRRGQKITILAVDPSTNNYESTRLAIVRFGNEMWAIFPWLSCTQNAISDMVSLKRRPIRHNYVIGTTTFNQSLSLTEDKSFKDSLENHKSFNYDDQRYFPAAYIALAVIGSLGENIAPISPSKSE